MTAAPDGPPYGPTSAPRRSPTRPPLHPPGLGTVLERNIETLSERRRQEQAQASLSDRIADRVTGFTGSMTFVVLHLLLFGFWIVANLGWVPGVAPWDESFVVLAMMASVEAIFLSTFVLISQNRMAAAADQRADLDLQISLLAEHEITKIATLLAAVADRLDVHSGADDDLREVQQDVAPDAVLDEIEAKERESSAT